MGLEAALDLGMQERVDLEFGKGRTEDPTLEYGALAVQDPGDGAQGVVGLSAGLQPDPPADGAGCAAGRSDPTPAQLPAYRTDLALLAAARWHYARRRIHPRTVGLDRRAARWSALWTGRASRREATAKTVFIAHKTQSGRARGNQEKRAPEKAALNCSQLVLVARRNAIESEV